MVVEKGREREEGERGRERERKRERERERERENVYSLQEAPIRNSIFVTTGTLLSVMMKPYS